MCNIDAAGFRPGEYEAPQRLTPRPATALREERAARDARGKDSAFKLALAAVTEKIEAAQAGYETQVTVLTLPDSVVKYLETKKMGYQVTYNPACHSGDMDSHTISWK